MGKMVNYYIFLWIYLLKCPSEIVTNALSETLNLIIFWGVSPHPPVWSAFKISRYAPDTDNIVLKFKGTPRCIGSCLKIFTK